MRPPPARERRDATGDRSKETGGISPAQHRDRQRSAAPCPCSPAFIFDSHSTVLISMSSPTKHEVTITGSDDFWYPCNSFPSLRPG